MSAEHSFQTLKHFFETRHAADQALRFLDPSVEIGIVIGESVECALFYGAGRPQLEQRPANQPDFVFAIRPETVVILNERTKDEIADIGANILKEMLAGDISVKLVSHPFNLIRRGYLELIRTSGLGLGAGFGVTKIVSVLRKMKN